MRVLLAPAWLQEPASLDVWTQALQEAGHDIEASRRQGGSARRALGAFLPLAASAEVIGGQSFGARLASLAAAQSESRVKGLILMAFPLAPDPAARCAHFPSIPCPALVLGGTRDHSSPLDELRRRVRLLPSGRLVEIEGAGHDLRAHAGQVLPHLLAFLDELASAR